MGSSVTPTEKMYVRDGVLKGDVKHKLLLKGGGHHRVDFKTIYRAKKAVKLPDYHFVDHRIEILNHDKDYNKVTVYESAVARNSTDGMDELYKGGTGGSVVSKGEETTMGVIKPDMKIKLKMEGNVNGHAFVIEGEGEGKPYDGTHTINLEVKEGAPLPFSYDILTTAFAYGNRAFTKYPDDIPDYFKQSFPEGYSWERTMTFEDKGIVKVKSDISMEEDSFIYEIHLKGENFPPNGPVMQKKTTGWLHSG
nr:cpTFP1 [synthetic construct]